ncbi:hypothetical protein LTR91_000825 [Friedmanniomyces endolithicus]|uniref:Uncharacterized protein n=1 Tax=Friedmanniomyces endolithicus TaxID=329885 RepID=A0AAN6L1H9_9PEZI|nr:hypothetical protein LTS09_002481 [Friedmanniomyces endolithicus]KAK0347607.1 hypothetical protein LTR94_001768 [Friedmanniomyces endolithicus]KAK0797585.1 hypothetical protein LTR59_006791 [Friedmanniomyces endolithicus]KAK0817169.1 hypothetical protein LTR38_001806 [Friedmanniomyces endolithicus]KAK0819964.1 hypothetical protein LTR75_001993 [Friedmanniomyces endolithicus]
MVTDGFDCEYADAVIADTRGDRTIARKNVVATENIDRHMRLTTHVVQGVAWCARPLMIAVGPDFCRLARTITRMGSIDTGLNWRRQKAVSIGITDPHVDDENNLLYAI